MNFLNADKQHKKALKTHKINGIHQASYFVKVMCDDYYIIIILYTKTTQLKILSLEHKCSRKKIGKEDKRSEENKWIENETKRKQSQMSQNNGRKK